jgi:aminoglycoside phosphotransferase (APT) family kinase protein
MTEDSPGRLIGTGRSADVYDIGDGRVLRRYRDGRPAAAVSREADVMMYAREHGVPVPQVFGVSESDIVMTRATGPTMLDVLARRPWTVRAQARLLARSHTLVHDVAAPDGLDAPFGDGAALLHMDLHPDNVILTAQGPLIIDWEGAAQGPAASDVAMTWTIIAFSQVSAPPATAAAIRAVQGLLTRCFLRAAGPVDPSLLKAAVGRRLTDPHLLPAEVARIRAVSADLE